MTALPSIAAGTSLHPLDGSHPFGVVTLTAAGAAHRGDLILLDTTGGTFAVSLPSSPLDGATIWVKWIVGTVAPTITAGAGDTISGAGGTYTFVTLTEWVELVYNESSTSWKVRQGCAPSVILAAVGGYRMNDTVQTANFVAAANTGYDIDTSSNTVQMTLPEEPPDGTIVYANIKTFLDAFTVVANTGDTLETTTSFTLGAGQLGILQYDLSERVWRKNSVHTPVNLLDARYVSLNIDNAIATSGELSDALGKINQSQQAPGTPFFVYHDDGGSTGWYFPGPIGTTGTALITTRPTTRPEVPMVAIGGAAASPPSFALTGDIQYATS